jgi:hypothetical protein
MNTSGISKYLDGNPALYDGRAVLLIPRITNQRTGAYCMDIVEVRRQADGRWEETGDGDRDFAPEEHEALVGSALLAVERGVVSESTEVA